MRLYLVIIFIISFSACSKENEYTVEKITERGHALIQTASENDGFATGMFMRSVVHRIMSDPDGTVYLTMIDKRPDMWKYLDDLKELRKICRESKKWREHLKKNEG